MADDGAKVLRLVRGERQNAFAADCAEIAANLRAFAAQAERGEIVGCLLLLNFPDSVGFRLVGHLPLGNALEIWERWKLLQLKAADESAPMVDNDPTEI